MCCAVVDSLLRITGGHQAVNEAGSEGVAAADAVHDLKAVVFLGLIDLSVCPADGLPVVDSRGADRAERGRDALEVRIGLSCRVDHLLVAFDVELFEILVISFDLEAEAGSEIFLIADHDVDIFCHFLIDFLSLLQTADRAPHGRTIVQVVGDDCAVLLCSLAGSNDGLAGLLGESSVDAAGVQPSDTEFTEDIVKIEISRGCLGDRSVRAVRAADCAADTEAPLCEVDAVAADTADSVGLLPVNERGVNAALLDEVLHQHTDFVVGKSSDHSCVHSEALVQTADNVVLAAAFPCAEASRGADAAFARIKSQHDLAEGNGIKSAFFGIS